MSKFLLEIMMEEIPARFMDRIISELNKSLKTKLEKNTKIRVMGTPRRLAIIVDNLQALSEGTCEEIKGPKKIIAYDQSGNPSKALMGFLKSKSLKIEDVFEKLVKEEVYIYVKKIIPGEDNRVFLPKLIFSILEKMSFPKTMKWGNGEYSFVRPVRNILCIFDSEVITVKFKGVTSTNYSRGHRTIFENQQVKISSSCEYEKKLRDAFVIIDQNLRREIIMSGIEKILIELSEDLFESKALADIDQELLKEVIFLTEFPTPFLGKYSDDYLDLPKEVITLTMKLNQKYFPVIKGDTRELLPYFIGVRCGNDKYIENVALGNEKVLMARLEDAKFFYKEDLEKSLDDLNRSLIKIVFHNDLGSYLEKVKRIESLSLRFGDFLELKNDEIDKLSLVAKYSKADLSSSLVFEFPELQGVCGYYFSLHKGLSKDVATGIYDHYKPSYSGESLPENIYGSIVALSDKIDTLIGMFGLGLIPTGSQDPFALRRATIGIIRIIIDSKIYAPIRKILELALMGYGKKFNMFNFTTLENFIFQRGKIYLEELGISQDIAESVLKSSELNFYRSSLIAKVIEKERDKNDFKALLENLKRIEKITKDKEVFDIDEDRLTLKAEKSLFCEIKKIRDLFLNKYVNDNYEYSLNLLYSLNIFIEEFFNDVMVMDENIEIRNNRIALISEVSSLGRLLFDPLFIVK